MKRTSITCLLIGFLAGNLFLAGLFYEIPYLSNTRSKTTEIAYSEELKGIESNQSKQVFPENSEIARIESDEPSDLFIYLFRILFWLFLISPPVIVILLLVIIRKMDSKNIK